MIMNFLDEALGALRKCFSREATHSWFAAMVIGMMLRTDKLGVTSMIRALDLAPRYDSAVRVFRSEAWCLEEAEDAWAGFVAGSAPLVRVGGLTVQVTDGVKVIKEGRRIPAVKRLHQESGNSAKPEYINVHLYGAVGVLAEANEKTYCIPLACEIQEGMKKIMSWRYGDSGERQDSHVAESIYLSYYVGESLGDTVLLADRLYLTVPALEELDWLNGNKGRRMELVTLAKSNATAYEEPPKRAPGDRGRTRIKGRNVKLRELFKERAGEFKTVTANIYGEGQEVRYLAVDLLWGKKLYRKMRFVLTILDGRETILACTDTSMDTLDIIELYARRYTIEGTFRALKQDVAAFSNRFWTLEMPKLDRYAESGEVDRAAYVTGKGDREKVLNAFDANERYAFCGVVALGLLQMISLKFFADNNNANLRYQRTPPKKLPSEAGVADFLRKSIFRLLEKAPELAISRKILGLMRDPDNIYEKKMVS